MVISTQTLAEASTLLDTVLVDKLQVLNVGDPVTVGTEVTRELTEVGEPIPGLVQSVTLENALEGRINQTYSIKVARGTELEPGQAVRVKHCVQEPALEDTVIFIDTMSLNGLALIRKGTGSIFKVVNQEGKGGLS